ncbi:family 1 glycosylhydrolase [Nocardia sp. NPDC051570]|uniref:family 1 glycosylhydrolase n=1 Tax=Nocardia sp. NPDC051570 TaxID=3364324 RepID=UPI003787E695
MQWHRGFRWGVAGSAFQSEGDMPPCNWQIYLADGKHPDLEPYHEAVDFRHRYREDIALARDLGAQVFRFGVNWARVEPERGRRSEQGWAYYRDVVAAIREAGMEPMPTLDHFAYPAWILDDGGWVAAATVDHFLAYVGTAVRELGSCPWWLVFNEPAVNVLMDTRMRALTSEQSAAMAANIVAAHKRAYAVIKSAHPDAAVSSNEATGNLPENLRVSADAAFLDQVADGYLDFLGLDIYYPDIDAEGMRQLTLGTPWNIPQPPDGIGSVTGYYAEKYPELPIFVIESGMPTDNGAPRADGLTRSQQLLNVVDSIGRARDRGVPIVGLLYWSLTDNYEWGSYRPRFGLYSVDVAGDPTLRRVPTDAVETFRKVITTSDW